jgi:hypothetical protein
MLRRNADASIQTLRCEHTLASVQRICIVRKKRDKCENIRTAGCQRPSTSSFILFVAGVVNQAAAYTGTRNLEKTQIYRWTLVGGYRV